MHNTYTIHIYSYTYRICETISFGNSAHIQHSMCDSIRTNLKKLFTRAQQ